MTTQLTWYTARAGGIVAWALAAASVLWGLALSTDLVRRRARPAWLLDLHRFLGGAALVFTAVHVGSILLDPFVDFSPLDILVPLASSWHPVAVAWGVAAMYLLLAVELTSLARRSMPTRLWRQVHLGSYGLFVVSTVHGLSSGTDARSPVFLGVTAAVSTAVFAMTAVRFSRRRSRVRVAARETNIRASLS